MTLIEILIVVALLAVILGITITSFVGTSSARLRQASTRVAGAVRVAYARATASGKVTRLVFDFGNSSIQMEETLDRHTLKKDTLGGDAASEAQLEAKDAAGASELRAPPATFEPVDLRKGSGVKVEDEEDGDDEAVKPVPLPRGIQFWQIDVEHQAEPVRDGKAYLYFFPGGQTENASVQLRIANTEEGDKTGFMSVIVSPLTGKAKILAGRADAPKPRDESEASEVEDPGR
ncbi:MAG: prepilin-type cleavage/methylation domain-containing protein [Polyangiaceae bacterium]|nr:prepilin-type cleavage/methylation domain-containing protein [Polyangiaceae bacterium]